MKLENGIISDIDGPGTPEGLKKLIHAGRYVQQCARDEKDEQYGESFRQALMSVIAIAAHRVAREFLGKQHFFHIELEG